jgi:hypothetical protein
MDDLERTLRRYRPAGPDGELRDRIVAAASSPSAERTPVRAREWLPAVAALVFAALFYWLATTGRRGLDLRYPPTAPADRPVVNVEELL